MHKSTGIWLLLLWLSACIGTDYVDAPLGTDRSALSLSPRSLSLMPGERASLTATYLDFDGEATPVSLQWWSEAPGIATVSATGEVAAQAPGQTLVRVESPDGRRDSCLVTVVPDAQAVATVVITGAPDTLGVGQTRMLTAEVRNQQGDLLTGPVVTWRSSDSSVVRVDEMGVVRGQAPGSASITAVADGISSLPSLIRVGTGARQGVFSGRSGYSVSGMVTLTTQGSGYELRFAEDFMAQPGPGLYVYLAPQASSGSGGAEIAALQANSGAQTYAIPASVDPADFSHVLIFCKPFGVVFGAAALE